jgi:plastocyanin
VIARALRASALALVCVIGAACGGPARASVSTDHIDLPHSYLFSPADITVPAHTTVTWTNSDQFTHSVHLLDIGEAIAMLKPGETFSHRFDAPGVYAYECSLHPQNMHGSVTVTAP